MWRPVKLNFKEYHLLRWRVYFEDGSTNRREEEQKIEGLLDKMSSAVCQIRNMIGVVIVSSSSSDVH